MAYTTSTQLTEMLPGKGRGVSATEVKLYLARALTMLEYEPETEREEALAEAFVETWAMGKLLRIQALRDGFLETPTADAMLGEATNSLTEYNNLRITEDAEPERRLTGVLDIASTFPPDSTEDVAV